MGREGIGGLLKPYSDRAREVRRKLDVQPAGRVLAQGTALGGLFGGVGLLWIGGWVGFGLCLLALAAAVWLGAGAEPVLVEEGEEEGEDIEPEEKLPQPVFKEPLEMVELPGGMFVRESYQVNVSPFAIGRYPVTRGLYRDIVGSEPDDWKGDKDDGRLPVNYVTWFDAVLFCNALSERVGLRPCYQIEQERVEWDREAEGYRLPTEAEWEYAVRAGTQTQYFFGDDPSELDRYAWFSRNSDSRVHPVGEKEPNPWGLHDMIGNVWEWCWDWYGKYPRTPVSNPVGADGGAGRQP